ncbi:MAG: OmpH family outer membrane protein, partial [Kangiellaceae bacterium]|nr:OmpH family outer membrane protein [Kangiellaceae bacterium]
MAQKVEITRQLQSLDSEFKLKKAFLDEDLSIAQKQELQKIQIKVIQAVKKVAADEKFDLILRAEAALHATDAANITDKVIAIISNPAG